RRGATLTRLFSNPQEWVPCLSRGRVAVLAWRRPGQPPAPRIEALRVDFDRLAFRPPAGPVPPFRLPDDQPALNAVPRRPRAGPADSSEAVQQIARFNALTFQYQMESRIAWESLVGARLVATAGLPHGPLANGAWALARVGYTYEVMRRPELARGFVPQV